MTASSLGVSRFTSTWTDCFRKPRTQSKNRPLVVYLHGSVGSANELVGGGGLDAVRTNMDEIVKAGFSVVAPTVTQTWGNAACLARITDAINWGRANLPVTNAPVVIVATSHGHVCALRYAFVNPGAVACIVGFTPAVDVDEVRNNDSLGSRAPIDTAWGVVYPAPLPANANPALLTAALAGLPMQAWYSSDDAVATPAALLAFAAATGMETHSVGPLGHGNAGVDGADMAAVVAFLEAHT